MRISKALRIVISTSVVLLYMMAAKVFALELGAISIQSNLNEPLSLRIEVLNLGDTSLQDVSVQMASAGEFVRSNTEWTQFLNDIRFSIESRPEGDYVTLTSNQVVSDPNLSLILETNWPTGRLVSEYNILFNLAISQDEQVAENPVSANSATLPVNTISQTQEIESEPPSPVSDEQISAPDQEPTREASDLPLPESASIAAAEPELVAEESASVVIAPADEIEQAQVETLLTVPADTLSDIALRVRPDNSVSIQQTMLALLELNPDAFIDRNINRMLSGQVLRVPSRAEIDAIDQLIAVDEVIRQNEQLDSQALVAPAQTEPSQGELNQGQLSVVTEEIGANEANDGAGSPINEENMELDRRIAELENRLALSQEEADRATIEREELNSRFLDLESQIDAAQEIIRLQDLQLAQLQDQMREAAALARAQAEIEAAAQVELETEIVQDPQLDQVSSISDLMRWLSNNTLIMLAAILLVIFLLVGFLLRRNRTSTTIDDDLDELAEQEFLDSDEDVIIEPGIVSDDTGEDIGSFDEALELDAAEVKNSDTFPLEEQEMGDTEFSAPAEPDVTPDLGGDGQAEEGSENESNNETSNDFDFDFNDFGFLADEEGSETESTDEAKELDLLSDDEVITKLELAYAYQKMGDIEGAKEILQEVMREGSANQVKEAKELMASLDNLAE